MHTLSPNRLQPPGAAPALRPGGLCAFTLIELLTVIAIIALLAGLLLPVLGGARQRARGAACMSQLKQLGVAMVVYTDEHDDTFPRSQHSAFTHGELSWLRTVAPYLGSSTTDWKKLLDGVYHCGSDSRKNIWSYGLNVYYELGPDDDYAGKPATWRRRGDVPRPTRTVLFAENNSEADHLMPNFWVSTADAVDVAQGFGG